MSESNPRSKVKDQINENLKRIYDETLQEPIPDRLTLLLEQLRQKTAPDRRQPDTDPQDGDGQDDDQETP